VQYMPDGWTMLTQGKFMPDTRISTNMPHVGILVGDLPAAKNFYEGIMGFHEIWRGAKNPAVLSWVHEQVPEGKNFLEFMLYSDLPAADKRGKYHHFCLEVPDVAKAKAILEQRAAEFDLVFSDVVMPGISGVELAHQIKARWPKLEVILTSGYSHILAEEGSHGFTLLKKPYSIGGLLNALRQDPGGAD